MKISKALLIQIYVRRAFKISKKCCLYYKNYCLMIYNMIALFVKTHVIIKITKES